MQKRNDGMINVLNGMNTIRYDPSRHIGLFRTQFITKQMSENMFIENGIFKKIVCTPADEALRAGFCIKDKNEEINSEKIISLYEDLGCEERFATALYWNSCFGGAAMFPVFNDGTSDLTEPLNENNLHDITEIRVFSAKEAIPMERNTTWNDINYGKPETYIINDESNGACFEVHTSRLILFPGLAVPHQIKNARDGWGGMILEQIYDDLIQKYGRGNKYAIDIMERMAQGILKIQGLIDRLSIKGGEEEVRQYLQNIDMVRNILNTLAIDSNDEYDIKSISLSGVKEILEKTQTMLSAVSEIPVTLLFGRSPGGQNATGEADFQQYYAMVQRIQRRVLKPRLSHFIYLLSKCSSYGINLPGNWHIEFNPLSIPSEKEKAETEKLKAEKEKVISDTLNTYVGIGGMDSIEVRNKLEEMGYKLDRTLDNIRDEGGNNA